MQSRSALIAGLAGLLTTSAAPPPIVPQRPLADARPSPVRCRTGDDRGDVRALSRTRVRAQPQPYAPGLPPPPPPPSVVVTGQAIGPAPTGPASIVRSAGGKRYAPQQNRERYDGQAVATIQETAAAPVSTFSVDVDTGSYANVRRFLTQGTLPPESAVRTEEMINYFRYDYPRPATRAEPFSVTTDVARTPWNAQSRLLRIGLRGYDVTNGERPPLNLVFLVDVSGSMNAPDKLPLVKAALTILADRLRPADRVAIVVYASSTGIVLDPTANTSYIKAAIDCLEAGGSTAGGAGIKLAYDTARRNFRPGGINRILLATDGDFNVGVTDNKELEALVRRNRDDGITLTTLGFGQGNYNEALMERIADLGNGNYAYIDSALEAQKVLDDEMSATLVTIAWDVKVQVEFNPAQVKEYRLIGYENRALAEEDFANDAVDAGDIGAGHQVTALYEIMPTGSPGWRPERRYPANRPAALAGLASPAGNGAGNGSAGGSELAFVKLRYKMPNATHSKLIARPVSARLMTTATAPRGDMAFVTAVAAYGQLLRNDPYLADFSFADAAALAGPQQGYARQEFVKLTRLARAQMAGPKPARE